MTTWLARRVGDRLLCGYQTAGQYGCQGYVADVVRFGDREVPVYPDGYVEDPPNWFLPSFRAQLKAAGPRTRRPHPEPGIPNSPSRARIGPLRVTLTKCTHRGHVNVVPGVLT